MIFFKAHKTAVVIYSSLLIKGLVGGARLWVFFSKKNNILSNLAEKKCHVVPRRHEYSYLMNKIMRMILPYVHV